MARWCRARASQNQVARVRQQVNGGPRVSQSLGVATHDPQSVGLADQNPAGWDTPAVTQRRVEDSQSMPRLPGQEQGHAQAREDVGFPVHVSGLARKPLRGLQLADCFTDITEVPEYHADRLVRDRGLRRGGVPSQHCAGGGEGFRWLRQRQRQQLVRLPGHRAGVRVGHLTDRI